MGCLSQSGLWRVSTQCQGKTDLQGEIQVGQRGVYTGRGSVTASQSKKGVKSFP